MVSAASTTTVRDWIVTAHGDGELASGISPLRDRQHKDHWAMRWVVAFKGSRDAYQVPWALAETGRLESLVTDWYSPFDRRWFRSAAELLPGRVVRQLRRRFCAGLPSRQVRALTMRAILDRVTGAGASEGDAHVGSLAGKLARHRGAGILSYSYYAHSAFTAYGDGPLPKVLLQVQAHSLSVRRRLEEEMRREPASIPSLSRELELHIPQARLRQLADEPLEADACIAASAFTKRTMVENGVPPERIQVIPYGVDLDTFGPPDEPPSGPFRVLFVGQLTHRKGLTHLLRAWKRLALPDAELVLVGRGRVDRDLLREFDGQFALHGPVYDRGELSRLYGSSDVLCVPSLGEGFGLVYLESLACGTPVIATHDTGAPDLVTEGGEGFLIDAGDVDALCERLRWCHAHRTELHLMRRRARHLAERHSWSAFRSRMARAIACAGAGLSVPDVSVPDGQRPTLSIRHAS